MKGRLHMLKSIVGDLSYRGTYYDKVPIRWFVVERSKDGTTAYENVVKEYFNQLDSNAMVPTINKLSTYFMHEECKIFKDYLARKHGWSVDVTCRRSLNPLKEAGIEKVFPRVGRWRQSYLNLSENGDYDLSFKVSGYCDWRRLKGSKKQDMKLVIKIDRETVSRLLQAFSAKPQKLPEPVKSAIVAAITRHAGDGPALVEIEDGSFLSDDPDDDFEEDLPMDY